MAGKKSKSAIPAPTFDLQAAPFGYRTYDRAIGHTCNYCDTYASQARPLIVVALGRYNAHALACDVCCEQNMIYCHGEELWSDTTVVVMDLPSDRQRCTDHFAHDNYYYVSQSHQWFASLDRAQRAQSRVDTTVYGYHETQPILVHGWPEHTIEHELCFGVELEMEHKIDSPTGRADMAVALGGKDGNTLADHDGKYILARDGSLNQTGVELITNPYTLQFHQDGFGWRTVLDAVKGIGQSGTGTTRCGMHVHCNRAAISALTLGKVLVFVNSAGNAPLVDKVAQRTSGFALKSLKGIRDGKVIRGGRKYDAVNVTEKTIEFRIFRGNLRVERVLKNIEFCHATITYCSIASIKACVTHTDFLAWLCANRGIYRNLFKFLAVSHKFKVTMPDTTHDI